MRRTNIAKIISSAAIGALIKNIHDPHYAEKFRDADVAELQTSLAKSELTHHELMNVSNFDNVHSMRELKRNYYACCKRFHPDTPSADPQRTEIFKLLNNAYEALLNTYKMPISETDTTEDEGACQENRSSFFRQNSAKVRLRSVDFIRKLKNRDNVHGIAISACGNFIATSTQDKEKITIINRHTPECLFVFPRGKEDWFDVTKMAFSLDAKKIVFFGAVDNQLRILDVSTGQYQSPKDKHKGHYVWNIKTLSNGNYISTAGTFDDTLKIWDEKTGRCIRTLKGHKRDVCDVIEIPGANRIISASCDETLKIWDINTGQCEHTFTEFKHLIDTVVLTPNGKYIIAGSNDGYFCIWDFETKKQIQEFKGYDWIIDYPYLRCASKGIFVSSDSCYFVSVANCKILKVWEIETGKQVGEKKITSHPASFCSHGDTMFLGCTDGSVKQITFANLELDLSARSAVAAEIGVQNFNRLRL